MTAADLLAPIRERVDAYRDHGTPGLHAPQDRARLLAALDAVLALHHETHRDFITADSCLREACDHEDECPIESLPVCHHCWEQLEQIDPYFGEDHHVSEVMWPCPTVAAVVAALQEGQ